MTSRNSIRVLSPDADRQRLYWQN